MHHIRLSVCISFMNNTMQGPLPKDPYQSIRYSSAFDQEIIWQQYRPLMERLGCTTNVFEHDDNDLIDMSANNGDRGYHIVQMDDADIDQEHYAAYQESCLKTLRRARRYALAEPGIYAGAEILAISTGAIAAMALLGKDSMGGSFAGFAAIFDSLRLTRGLIQSGYNLISVPDNVLESYEDRFAKNKCFIPRALWPKIMRELVSARQNEFSREKHTNFLQFALGFATCKAQPVLNLKDRSIDDVKRQLSGRLRNFFDTYTYDEHDEAGMYRMGLNVEKFIDRLFDQSACSTPRYMYLHGTGGIGKTYCVHKLSQWINEVVPVNFENIVINSVHDLEGNEDRPGALLKVLYNQLAQNKRGSIVMLDEATWLNDPAMIPAAKRTFNADQSTLNTEYFGTGSDGSGIPLTMPPMLIFVASNNELEDVALASRFDIIRYPMPSERLLIDYAIDFAQKSSVLTREGVAVDNDTIERYVGGLDKQQRNFRHIEASVEAELLRKVHSKV